MKERSITFVGTSLLLRYALLLLRVRAATDTRPQEVLRVELSNLPMGLPLGIPTG